LVADDEGDLGIFSGGDESVRGVGQNGAIRAWEIGEGDGCVR